MRDQEFNVRWLRAVRRILKADGALWVMGTHHIIFSLGFALQTLGYRIINNVIWEKPDPVPNFLHTAFTHLKSLAILLSPLRVGSTCKPGPRGRGYLPLVPSTWMHARAD